MRRYIGMTAGVGLLIAACATHAFAQTEGPMNGTPKPRPGTGHPYERDP